MAFAKLESRLRRVGDRRKCRHGAHPASRAADLPGSELSGSDAQQFPDGLAGRDDDVVAIQMEGDGPLVVREKFHGATPMTIDQALFEMELVGHDFFLFRDSDGGGPSVVYRRRGYQYGVIRLVENDADERGAVPPIEPEAAGEPAQDARSRQRAIRRAMLGSGRPAGAAVAGREAG